MAKSFSLQPVKEIFVIATPAAIAEAGERFSPALAPGASVRRGNLVQGYIETNLLKIASLRPKGTLTVAALLSMLVL